MFSGPFKSSPPATGWPVALAFDGIIQLHNNFASDRDLSNPILRVEEDIEILELSQYVEKSHASNTK